MPCLEATLVELGLTVPVRTDMITHWLPAVLRHRNYDLAVRILPQSDLERAAPLQVSPRPA